MLRIFNKYYLMKITAAWLLPVMAGAMLFSMPSVGRTPIGEAAGEGDTLRIAFVGDVLLDRGVRKVVERHGPDILFAKEIDSVFGYCNRVVANLECPVTHLRAPVNKRFIFRGEPEWLEALCRHGITHLNMANNHTMDQGRNGLLDTRHNVIRYGMTPFGMDTTADAACLPLLLADQPRAVWVFTSSQVMSENWAYLPDRPSVCECTIDTLVSRVAEMRRRDTSALIIVMLHWGVEHDTLPTIRQRISAHRLIASGADCIVGHHTHTVQTVEWIMERPVCYGIGNFIFDPLRPINASALIFRADVTQDTAIFHLLPVRIDTCTPRLAYPGIH